MSNENGHSADTGDSELDLYIENGEVLICGPTEAPLAYVEQLHSVRAQVTTEMLTGRPTEDVAASFWSCSAVMFSPRTEFPRACRSRALT